MQESGQLSVKDLVPATALDIALPAASTASIFLLFGISFYQEVNVKYYPLQNGVFNALSIIDVSGE